MCTAGRKLPGAAWIAGQLLIVVGMASCSDSEVWIAPKCGPDYMLGCVGDGRPDSETTPDSVPTRTCAKSALTLFKVHVLTSLPRDEIAQCRMTMTSQSSWETVADYVLASGQEPNGKAYGCLLGETKTEAGYLSYSSCCAEKETLAFHLEATSASGEVLQEGEASAVCAHYPPEVGVEVQTEPLD